MFNERRPLQVFADNHPIAEDNRIRIRGRSCMTLMPDFSAVEIYNLSSEDLATLRDAKTLAVYGEQESMLCFGEIEDIYFSPADANEVTTISVSDGKTFWEAGTEKALNSGISIRSAIASIADTIAFGTYLAADRPLYRGQTYSCRQAEAVSMLAKSVNARAFVYHNTLHVVEKGKTEWQLDIPEDEVITDPKRANGMIILKTKVKGYPVGIIAKYAGVQYRIVAQSLDADNLKGPWNTEVLLVDEHELDENGMEGG